MKSKEQINIINEKVNLAKKYFAENLSDEKIKYRYLNFFNKLSYQTKIYK